MTPKTLPALPTIPNSIPKHILDEAKRNGFVYVGTGASYTEHKHIFRDGDELSLRYNTRNNSHEISPFSGSSPHAHYFTSPKVAAKYFAPPKKAPTYTRGAKGRFVSKNPPATEEKEKKSRQPKIGEVWLDGLFSDPYLVARLNFGTVNLFSLESGNRYYDTPRKEDGLELPEFTFAAASPAEYFAKKS